MSPETWKYLVKMQDDIYKMSEPKFGEWQKGIPPKGIAVLWMPLPCPPKEGWEEEFKEQYGSIYPEEKKLWYELRDAFKRGFEAGRKHDRRNV